MKNTIVLIVSIITSCTLIGREIRTPLPISSRGYNHYPLYWPIEEQDSWAFNTWGIGLHRDTDRAFGHKDNMHTYSLSQLYFGAEAFATGALFAPNTTIPSVPNTLVFRPRFDYKENTAVFGGDVGCSVGSSKQWNIGARAHIPFRSIKVTLNSLNNEGTSPSAGSAPTVVSSGSSTPGATLSRALSQYESIPNPITGNDDTVECFAYRMDLVASINQQQAGPGTISSFVDPTAPLYLDNNDATNDQNNPENGPSRPIQLISTPLGTPPTNYCAMPNQVTTPLPADGTSTPGTHYYFDSATNYTPLVSNQANLQRLWLSSVVIPGATINQVAPTQVSDKVFTKLQSLSAPLTPYADQTQSSITVATAESITTAALNQLGITFASQHRYQVGDLDAEFYCNRYWQHLFAEGVIGLRIPTGRAIEANRTGNLLIAQTPTGNNRHVEFHFGGMIGWNQDNWIACKADAYYNYAFSHNETVAGAYFGGSVANLGVSIPVSVNWHYFVGDVDLTLMPFNVLPQLGIDIGYQLYAKTSDHIRLNRTALVPFDGGVLTRLNESLLRAHTHRVAHKVKTEIFYEVYAAQFVGGFAHTFAGKNAMRDTDLYAGITIYF